MATDDDLKAILGEGEGDPTPPAQDDKEPQTPPKEDAGEKEPEESPEVKAKKEQLANLDKAIKDEQDRLRKSREARRTGKSVEEIEEDELPKIDLNDPSAKAWDKRIRESAEPANRELEKAKEERRIFALRQFLLDKPSLAKSPERLKTMMGTYDKLKTSTELTSEGITMDLEKAYAAEFSEELLRAARSGRIEGARNDAFFSDAAVSRGSSTFQDDKKEDKAITLSDDEKAQLAKWNMTPAEWIEMKKKYG